MNRKQRKFIKSFLIFFDIVTTVVSFFVAYVIRDYYFRNEFGGLQGLGVYAWMLGVIIPFWPVLLNAFNLYNNTIYNGFHRVSRVIRNLFPPVLTGTLLLTSIFYFYSRQEISRLFMITFAVSNIGLLAMEKTLIQYFWDRKARDKANCRKVIVVTSADRNYFTEYAEKNPHFLIDIIGYVRAGDRDLDAGKPVLGGIDQLIEIVKNNVVDEVVFDLPNQSMGQWQTDFEGLVFECENMGVSIHVVMYTFNMNIAKPEIAMLGSTPLLTFKATDFSPGQMMVKRMTDIAVSVVGLIFTAASFIFIALAIKLESDGPIFFSQNRMGRNGRVFKVYKYRSMYKDAEERKKQLMRRNELKSDHMFKITNDPRVTKVGRFIRRTSLDELPQFWNILNGDMSLVGTRPPTLDEVHKYETRHWRRLSIKPGLTGMWQVSGRSDILDFDEVVRLDLEYIDRWSIWLDMKIILKTIPVVFGMNGSK